MLPLLRTLACAFVAAAIAFAAPSLAHTEEGAVRVTIGRYLHGLKFNDVTALKSAFHPEAKLFFVKKDGSLGQLSQEQWYKGFESSAGKEEPGDLSILSLDVAGNVASAKVSEVYTTSTYTDYITLLKLADGWRIVNKVYYAAKRSTARVR